MKGDGMSFSRNGTVLLECGIRVLAFMLTENQPRESARFRCVRGLALNAQNGYRYGDK